MLVCCECCVLSGRSLCDELITRPEESQRLWYVGVCDLETSTMRRPWPALDRSSMGGGGVLVNKRGIVNLKKRRKTPKDFSRTGNESDSALRDKMDVCASLNFHNKQRLLSYILLTGICNWDRVFFVKQELQFWGLFTCSACYKGVTRNDMCHDTSFLSESHCVSTNWKNLQCPYVTYIA